MAVLRREELDAGLARLPEWHEDGATIVRQFAFDDFAGSIAFVNRLAEVAERMNHHPDLAIGWNRVTVTIGSHRLGAVTDQCLELASAADRLAG